MRTPHAVRALRKRGFKRYHSQLIPDGAGWAQARRLVVEMDSTVVPLATADIELIEAFEGVTQHVGSRDRPVTPASQFRASAPRQITVERGDGAPRLQHLQCLRN